MGNKNGNIPFKVIISYIALVALVASVGWILYSENVVYTKIEGKIALEKNKVLRISNLFSNVYKTESLARKTIQSNSEIDFRNYIQQTDSLQIRIDSLKKVVSSDYQIKLLDSVTILLNEKTQNIRQLKAIKSKTTDEASVNEAIQELTQLEFSLRKLQLSDFTKNPDKLGSYQRNVLQRYVDYLNQNIPDDSSNTLTKKATDSILSASKRLLSKVKLETEKKKESLSLQENKLLTNEILISDQLRKVLRIIEREIIFYSIKNNNEKEKSLKKINQIITYAAIVGLLLTVFFSILITSDFSKTQSYKKQLEIANDKTQNLLKSREQLISTVSHDLKTPLSTIVGYTELLGHSDLNNKQSYYTKTIKNSSEYIARLVQDLLDFSQIEAGKITIEKAPFSLDQTLREVAANLQSVYQQKPIELNLNIDETFQRPILGDAIRLKQVLLNIIGNAYKFTAKGYININASLSANGEIAFISIADSGIGIEKNSQKLVFEEFAQANTSIVKNYGGTGLGLAISKKIMTLLGGELYLKNSSEKGSIFEIRMPVHFDSDYHPKSSPIPNLSLNLAPKTVVLVDDDADLLGLSTEVLKKHFTVAAFLEAEKALDFMQNQTFDVLVTDIQMPNMTGFELVAAFQKNANEKYHNEPIIAVTGQSNVSEEVYQKAGFSTVIKKPFSPSLLIETVTAVLNHTQIPLQAKKDNDTKTTQRYSLQLLEDFLNKDTEAIQKVLQSFVTNTHLNMDLLKSQISELDGGRIKQTAHKMAPMFKQIEAHSIARILDDLESNDYTAIALNDLYHDLEEQITALFTELEKRI
ncbi:ATP-binding protein [Flavobacterium agrisoli]|uniref:histidine kinase n=1 Tax=Flavobacterium agrisoli TaxID=2793066 RepID=A0A934PM80_9FLAO|nr:ATP-binding protein [Flavobacterium agrisoli]MBK0369835.1 response regulator [Flavobacterium agrisoli]